MSKSCVLPTGAPTTSDTEQCCSWWAGTSQLRRGGSSGDTGSGRHFYTPLPRGGMLVRVNTQQETIVRQIVKVVRDQADAPPASSDLRKVRSECHGHDNPQDGVILHC